MCEWGGWSRLCAAATVWHGVDAEQTVEAALPSIEDDDRPKPAARHEIGQDLSQLSLEEIDRRIVMLQAEIARLQDTRISKEASRFAADAFFKK
jgi:uncharacterized small protein (DUF1192 family)